MAKYDVIAKMIELHEKGLSQYNENFKSSHYYLTNFRHLSLNTPKLLKSHRLCPWGYFEKTKYS